MKLVIFDSGPLINLSMNGLLPTLENLKKEFKGKYLVTQHVIQEVYEHPRTIPQFELGALTINSLIQRKILERPETIGVSSKVLDQATNVAIECANSSFKVDGRSISIVSHAEMSCLALAQQAKQQGHEVLLVIDERTARLLCEAPERIADLMSTKLHTKVIMDKRCNSQFKGLPCIRSSELVYVAYKKKLIPLTDPQSLEALIYATKFKGAAISWEEMAVLKKL